MEFWCFILVLGFITGPVSAVRPVTVKLHDPAVLRCSGTCSGVVRWTEFRNPFDPLAECDQTSCRSVKEGYQMIYDQYLQGDLSLNITEADFSKRGLYTCECDGQHQCDVNLRIEAVKNSTQMKPGGSLLLYVDMSEPMEVIYNSTGTVGRSSGQICTVTDGSLQCKPEYTKKASLLSAVELRGMEESDSGVYTVRDTRNEEVIHTHTLAVRDCPTCVCPKLPESPAAGVPVWVVVVLVLLMVLLMAGCVVGAERIVKLKIEIRKFWNGSPGKAVPQNGAQSNGQPSNHPEQQSLNEDTV